MFQIIRRHDVIIYTIKWTTSEKFRPQSNRDGLNKLEIQVTRLCWSLKILKIPNDQYFSTDVSNMHLQNKLIFKNMIMKLYFFVLYIKPQNLFKIFTNKISGFRFYFYSIHTISHRFLYSAIFALPNHFYVPTWASVSSTWQFYCIKWTKTSDG